MAGNKYHSYHFSALAEKEYYHTLYGGYAKSQSFLDGDFAFFLCKEIFRRVMQTSNAHLRMVDRRTTHTISFYLQKKLCEGIGGHRGHPPKTLRLHLTECKTAGSAC